MRAQHLFYLLRKRSTLPYLVTGVSVALMVLLVFAAVLLPWGLARSEGMAVIHDTLEDLVSARAGRVRTRVLQYLGPARSAAAEVVDSMMPTEGVPVPLVDPADEAGVLRKLVEIALRWFPDRRVRYVCWAAADGVMMCVAVDRGSGIVQLQVVRGYGPNGTLGHQLQWDCDPVTNWNSTYPAGGDDLGEYNPLLWAAEIIESEGPYWPGSTVEVTNNETAELLASLYAPARYSNGTSVAGITVDFLTDTLSESLRSFKLSSRSEMAVIDVSNNLVGCSLEGTPYALDSSEYPVPMPVLSVQSFWLSTVSARLLELRTATNDSETEYSLQEDVNGEQVYAFLLPVPEAEVAAIIAAPRKDFTEALERRSRNAILTVVFVLLGSVVTVGGVVLGVSLALVKLSRQVREEDEQELVSTSLETTLSRLEKLKTGVFKGRKMRVEINSLVKIISRGVASQMLYKPDPAQLVRLKNMNGDQEVWLRAELYGELDPTAVLKSKHLTVPQSNTLAVPPPPGQLGNSLGHSLARENTLGRSLSAATMDGRAEMDDADPRFLRRWSFPTRDCSLVEMARMVAGSLRLCEKAKISQESWDSFTAAATEQYRDGFASFHNSHHAADVLHALHYFITRTHNIRRAMSPVELLALVVAGVVINVQHPGTTNSFEVRSGSDAALVYNDQSVLENVSARVGLSMAANSGLLENLTSQERRDFRRNVAALVVATDLSRHFSILAQFTSAVSQGGLELGEVDKPERWENRLLLGKVLLKMADVAYLLRPTEAMRQWSSARFEEFSRMLEEETRLQLADGTPRPTAVLAEASLSCNTLQFVLSPLYATFIEWRPMPTISMSLLSSTVFWQNRSTSTSHEAWV